MYGPTSTGKTFTMQGDTHTKGSLIKSMFEGITTSSTQSSSFSNEERLKHKKTLSSVPSKITSS